MASVRLHTSEGPMKICILHFLQLLNNVSPLSRWSEVVETSYVVDTCFVCGCCRLKSQINDDIARVSHSFQVCGNCPCVFSNVRLNAITL